LDILKPLLFENDKRVYNPNKGDTFLHQNNKALNQKINAKTLKKAKKDAKSDYTRFLKWFSLRAFFNPSRLCVKYLQPLFGL
jgi:hypothetical protein